MAILLTNNYQEISRVYLDYAQLITYAKYSDQSRDNNTTTYQLKTTYYIPTQATVSFGSANAYLDDAVKTYGYTTFYRGETTVQEITRTITHNDDGSSPTKSVYSAFYASFGGGGETRADIIFPPIQRYAIATSGTNFTDETNPTITFSNVGLYGLRAKVKVGTTEIYSQDLQDRTVTSHTFLLNTSQRNQLRQLCTGQSMTVTLAICSTHNKAVVYTSPTDVTMTIVNANPTFTYTTQEQTASVISLLGSDDGSTVIKGASRIKFTIPFSTLKYSTASTISVKEGIVGDIIQSYTTPNPTSPFEITMFPTAKTNTGKFILTLTDSRGFSKTVEDNQRTIIDYDAVKINDYSFKRQSPISSNIIFNGDFYYWGNSIGSYTNEVTVKYKLDDGNWVTIPSTNYTIDSTNHKLTITNYIISNILVYTSIGQFSIKIEDVLTSKEDTSNKGKVLQGVPTFEAGEHDFQVNGTLYIADTDRANRKSILDLTYPVGSIYMSVNNTSPATLFGGTWEQIEDTFLLSAGSTYTAGDTGGAASVTLAENQLPKISGDSLANIVGHQAYDTGSGAISWDYIGKSGSLTGGDNIPFGRIKLSIGNGEAHNNMPPYLVVYMWKRTA
jgi:hypothetical protein